jgi:hypothetical protein
MKRTTLSLSLAFCALALTIAGCTSMKTPAKENIAASKNAVENATSADAGQLAPAELQTARDKLARANKAMADENYKLANELAIQAQADAKVATSKANSAKAQAAADALNTDVRVLQEELNRKNNQ